HSSARIVWKASIAVTDARTMSMRKNIAESDAAVSAPAAPRITCAGVKLLIHAESADHFHVSSAAQQPATTRYDAIWTRVIGREARSAAAVDCRSFALTHSEAGSGSLCARSSIRANCCIHGAISAAIAQSAQVAT